MEYIGIPYDPLKTKKKIEKKTIIMGGDVIWYMIYGYILSIWGNNHPFNKYRLPYLVYLMDNYSPKYSDNRFWPIHIWLNGKGNRPTIALIILRLISKPYPDVYSKMA